MPRRRIFADGDTEQAHVAHLAPQVHGELVAAVDFGRARRDFGGGKLLDRFAQRGDVVAVVKGQAWEMEHVVLVVISVAVMGAGSVKL